MDEFEGLLSLAYDHLTTSEILVEQGKYKFSISHSYYAMYFIAKALLYKIDFKNKTHE